MLIKQNFLRMQNRNWGVRPWNPAVKHVNKIRSVAPNLPNSMDLMEEEHSKDHQDHKVNMVSLEHLVEIKGQEGATMKHRVKHIVKAIRVNALDSAALHHHLAEITKAVEEVIPRKARDLM